MDWTLLRQQLLGDQVESGLADKLKLPTLPTVITKICQLAKDPKCNASDMGKLVEQDAFLTCELLKVVNSSAYGLRSKISTAGRAVAVLGLKKTWLLLVGLATNNMVQKCKSPVILTQQFSASSLERGLFAKRIAEQLGGDKDVAFSAGMLQDFLLPVLAEQMTEQYATFSEHLKQEVNAARSLGDLERNQFGWDHSEAGARVMLEWGFPDELVCLVYVHHRVDHLSELSKLESKIAPAVAVSSCLPDFLNQTPHGLEFLKAMEEVWPDFNLESVAAQVHEDLQDFGISCPGYQSLYERLQAVPA